MNYLKLLPATIWTWLMERVWENFRSTKVGGVVMVGTMAFMQLLGCDMSLVWQGAIAVAAGMPKILGTDNDKIAATLWELFQQGVTKNKQVIAIVIMAMALSACSAAQIQKEKEIVARLKQDGKTLIVTGCKDLPAIEVAASLAAEFYPPSAAAVTIGEKYAEAFCAKVLAAQQPS